MNALNIVYDRFISGLYSKKTGNIGVELEFPLINLNKNAIDINFAVDFLKLLVSCGFAVDEIDGKGNLAFVSDENGDVVSFDNSYNNIEFSMKYGDNLLDIKERFYKLYGLATDYFSPANYIVAGMGTNLFKPYIKQAHVDFPVYNMVDKFLHEYDNDRTHEFPDFPAYLSSVQTHLDIAAPELPETADFFSKMDFAAAYIFSNSLSFINTKQLCFRDYLWEKSAFGLLRNNTGSVDKPYRTLDGLAESYLERSMFNRIRNGKYEIFQPMTVQQYFEKSDAVADDINAFLSFRNIEVTARGTVEIRSTCSQPISEALAPCAFYLGLAHNLECACGILDGFFEQYNITESNSSLRKLAVFGYLPPDVDENGLKRLLVSLVKASELGLKMRKKNEEILLRPLYSRAENLSCPAKIAKNKLENGEDLRTIITDFSKI